MDIVSPRTCEGGRTQDACAHFRTSSHLSRFGWVVRRGVQDAARQPQAKPEHPRPGIERATRQRPDVQGNRTAQQPSCWAVRLAVRLGVGLVTACPWWKVAPAFFDEPNVKFVALANFLTNELYRFVRGENLNQTFQFMTIA
jgi:hypothetical protein